MERKGFRREMGNELRHSMGKIKVNREEIHSS